MELWTFVDMNSYFASCEQQDRPELRGRPIGVAPVAAETTCFIAASYEAKAYGIKTGTLVAEARRLCPSVTVVVARPALYRKMHFTIVDAVHSVVPVHEVLSVDELVCKPWKNEAELSDAIRLGRRVQDRIRDQVGEYMDCSIGLGPNIFMAKVASDMQKPRGCSVILPSDIPHKMYSLDLTDWPGISKGMKARFNRAGVFTTQEMYQLPINDMRQVFGGIVGERWWKSIRGLHVDVPPIKRSSIGHSNVLAPEHRDPDGARTVVFRMLEKAAERMRHEGYHAQRLEVHIFSRADDYWSRHVDFMPCNRTSCFMKWLNDMWSDNPPLRHPHSVGVTLQKIIPDIEVTMNLFDDPRCADLDAAIDRINSKYGRTTVVHACALGAAQALSHERIPFGKPTDMR